MMIDDAFIVSDNMPVDITQILNAIQSYREAGIEKTYLSKALSSISSHQHIETPLLFRKGDIAIASKQTIWYQRFYCKAMSSIQLLSKQHYRGITLDTIKTVAQLSRQEKAITKVVSMLLKLGILLIFVEAPSGSKIDGAVLQPNDTAMAIGLSLRYKRLDYFWFTLLHELGHLYAHASILKNGIISEEESTDELEVIANRIAKDCIISRNAYRTSIAKRTLNESALLAESKAAGVHPALLAGLIRKDLNQYTVFNDVINGESILEYV